MIQSMKLTIGQVHDLYKEAAPKEAQLVFTAFRYAYQVEIDMPSVEFKVFLNHAAIEELKGKLAPEGSRWHTDLENDLITRGHISDSYLKSYPRAIRRFLKFADNIGPVKKIPEELLPEWEDLWLKLQERVPGSKEILCRFRQQGVSKIAGYDILQCTIDEASRRMQAVRYNFHRLARKASAEEWSPQDFGQQLLSGDDPYKISGYYNKNIGYYFAKNAWNYLIECFPELALPAWPERAKKISIPWEELPEPLQVGVYESLLSVERDIKASTRKTAKNTFTAYMGILKTEGFNISILTDGLCPKDAFRLFFQGLPREMLSTPDHPRVICQQLEEDPQYKEEVLSAMRRLEGSHDGKESDENPFIRIAMEVRYANAQYPAARNLIKDARSINQDYLVMRGRHLEWLRVKKKAIDEKTKQRTSPYDAKKEEAFKNPELWLPLLLETQRLASCLFTDPRKGSVHWAANVRNILFLNLILVYPLRINHFVWMMLGKHFLPDGYRIMFDARETKNRRSIDLILPEKGFAGGLRKLVDLYLEEARPLLLKGRISPYFFVPSQQVKNAGIHIREKGFNDILIELSKHHLQHLLPPSLGQLNPHLIRHIVASYQLVVRGDSTRAAQFLNDELQTVHQYYSDVRASAQKSLKKFLEESAEEQQDV